VCAGPKFRNRSHHTLLQAFGKREYIVYEDERITYEEAHQRVAALANLFSQRGVGKGDRVAIASRNLPEFILSFWAASILGAVVVPVNAWFPLDALLHCLMTTNCRLAIVDDERAAVLQGSLAALREAGCRTLFVARPSSNMEGYESLTEALASCDMRCPPPDVQINPDVGLLVRFPLLYIDACLGRTMLASSSHLAQLTCLRESCLLNGNSFRIFSTRPLVRLRRYARPGTYTDDSDCTATARALLQQGLELPKPDPTAPQKAILLVRSQTSLRSLITNPPLSQSVPLFHVIGSQSLLTLATSMGGRVSSSHPFPRRFSLIFVTQIVMMRKWDVANAAFLIKKERVTLAGGVPHMVMELVELLEGEDHALEGLTFGGAPASSRLPETVARFVPGVPAGQGYGL
jgi:acyl-CoA synthetase (AMP-forming)/AMP-acid ligase II